MITCPHCSEKISQAWSQGLCPFCGKSISPKLERKRWFTFRNKNSQPDKKGKKRKKVVLIPAENAVIAPFVRVSNIIMVLLTLFTLGLFPVYWFAQRFPRFNRLARRDKQINGWIVAIDLGMALTWWCTLVLGFIRICAINNFSLFINVATIKLPEIILTWPFLTLPIGLVLHKHLILWARWNLRSFVSRRNRELAKNVAPSWLLLWLLGGVYLQYHINKLYDVNFFVQKETLQQYALIKIQQNK